MSAFAVELGHNSFMSRHEIIDHKICGLCFAATWSKPFLTLALAIVVTFAFVHAAIAVPSSQTATISQDAGSIVAVPSAWLDKQAVAVIVRRQDLNERHEVRSLNFFRRPSMPLVHVLGALMILTLLAATHIVFQRKAQRMHGQTTRSTSGHTSGYTSRHTSGRLDT